MAHPAGTQVAATSGPIAELLGDSPGIQAVRETIRRLLERQSTAGRLPPLLVQGETGTGKGLLARLLHRLGPRKAGPFVDVNCAAIPETLLEAELFGFERGAFTDARHAKPGLFQTAHRGTLFLDEIGLLPEGLQSKLLTVIEERVVRRLGSTRPEPVDIWIVTATNDDLALVTRQGRFREDLYHRLAVLTVALPPLRERGGDVLSLAGHFLARACAEYGLPPKTLGPDARAALLGYPWPGNVRELANVMERVALLGEGSVVTADLLALPEAVTPTTGAGEGGLADDAVSRLERERDALLRALVETNWNISRAAARLGLPRNTIRYRIAKHQLRRDPLSPAAPAPVGRPEPAPRRTSGPASAAPAGPAPTPPPSTRLTLRWERRRLTFLRAALEPPAGGERASDTGRALEVLVEKVQSFGGRVEELSPTALVASFGLEALEDATRRAAHAAMTIQKIAERTRRHAPERPAVRLALHIAEARIGQGSGVAEVDADDRREAWMVLDGLVRAAAPETILVSAAAAPFLARRFELTPARAAADSAAAYRLIGLELTGFGRRLSPFVGRRDELTLLASRLATAQRGHGQIVGIGGEAGIGKSRLLFEFRQGLRGAPVTYLEGHCVSYGTTIPYLPLVEMLRQSCRVAETDSSEVVIAKVEAGVRAVGMDSGEAAPYLLHLLGVKEGTEPLARLSPEAIQARMFRIMWQLSFEGSRRRPLILAIEDVHWLDAASEAYLDSLVESLAGAAILLLFTHRPGARPRWLDKSYATQISLQPLAPEESLAVVRAVLPPPAVAERLAQRLCDQAEGNPFFLEELARTVEADAELTEEVAVPGTVQDVLLARIDRLPEAPRRLLQTAAVLGRAVPRRLCQAVWEGPGDVLVHLRELVRLEFLYDRPEGNEPTYVFTHALTRDVACESLPPEQRLTIHAAAARALEALHAGRLEAVYDRLAYHYVKAKMPAQAVEYLTRFAEQAAGSYAHVEAAAALREALGLAERLPPEMRRTRLDLVLRLAHCLSFLGRFEETRELLLGEQRQLDEADQEERAGPFHFWLAHTYGYLGDHERATFHAQRALEAAERSGDEETMGRAYVVLAQAASWTGQPVHGIARGRRAVALLESAGERWWLGRSHWIVGVNYITIGAFGPALEAEARALAVGELLGDPRIRSDAIWTAGWIRALAGDAAAGVEACRQALGLSSDALSTAVILGHLGYVHLEAGEVEAALGPLQQAVDQMARFGSPQLQGRFTTFLGEAYLLQGRLAEARALATRGLAFSREARYWYGLGWAQHALGRLAHAEGKLEEAEAILGEALETFARIHARFLAARTRLSLARLAEARGDRPAAARHLGEAHAVFRGLGLPAWTERAEQLAGQLGVPLAQEAFQARLAIVRRGEAELFETLQEHVDALALTQVIWDRRAGERRQATIPVAEERRRRDRRQPAPATWASEGFLIAAP